MPQFNGRVAIVSGAASGLGLAIATRLAREGAQVVLADIQHEAADAVAHRLSGLYDGTCRAVYLDCGNADPCSAIVDDVLSHEGKLDILCNVAGILDGGHSEDFPVEAWDRVIQINLSGVFYLTRAALPHLAKSKGVIINIASTAGLMGLGYLAAYCAAKAGLVGLTRSLAVEFASRGVRINAVCPAGMSTNMKASFFEDGDFEESVLTRMKPRLVGRATSTMWPVWWRSWQVTRLGTSRDRCFPMTGA